MNRRLRLTLGAIFFALMFFHVGARTYSTFVGPHVASRRGWSARAEGGSTKVSAVAPDGPATALRGGDEIIEIRGANAEPLPPLPQFFWLVPPGTPYKVVVRRDGQLQELALQTVRIPQQWSFSDVYFHLTLLLFLGVALTVFVLRTEDRRAVLLAAMLGSLPALIPWSQYVGIPGGLFPLIAVAELVSLSFLPVFLHFFLLFPEPSPVLRRFPRLEWLLYLPALLFFLPRSGTRNIALLLGRWPAGLLEFLQWPFFRSANIITVIGYLALGLASLLLNYSVAGTDARRRLRVVMAGSGAGFLNLLLMPLGDYLDVGHSLPRLWGWLNTSFRLTLPLIPLSFAYAIIRHQVIPVSLIIRRGVRYLLVSRGSLALAALVVVLALYLMFDQLFYHWPASGRTVGIISAVVSVAVWAAVRHYHQRLIAPLIDRHFFRESYDAQQIMAELSEGVRATPDLGRLLELVATRIQSALHAENLTVFLRDEQTGDYTGALSATYNEAERRTVISNGHFRLPGDAYVVERLGEAGRPLNADLKNPDSPLFALWLKQIDEDNPHRSELETLEKLRTALLLPLATKDGMLGLISLGPRLGDLPYSGEDERLLMGVAGPSTFAIENARLVERMLDEARHRQTIEADNQRKTAELDFARQIQLSMLPKNDVRAGDIEIIGRMRTATEVGGDYYDFIALADGRYCVAIGDATGHGVAAGLLVGMVKMGLRSGLQSLNGQAGVKSLIEDLNLALRQSLARRGMGMCIGAAIIDPASLEAEIGSSGMPFPYLYQSADGRLVPLRIQSPPIGFLKRISVTPQTVRLEPGDALVWLSDGFEERMNPEGELWGADQVAAALAEICRTESEGAMIARRLIEACDLASGGRGNDDDMTIVVAKVCV